MPVTFLAATNEFESVMTVMLMAAAIGLAVLLAPLGRLISITGVVQSWVTRAAGLTLPGLTMAR